MQTTAYDWDAESLVDALCLATARVTLTRPHEYGYEQHIDRMIFLRGVVLSRLEGVERPFKEGQLVRLGDQDVSVCISLNDVRGRTASVQPGDEYEIIDILYRGSGSWSLMFKEDMRFRFPAERFEMTRG